MVGQLNSSMLTIGQQFQRGMSPKFMGQDEESSGKTTTCRFQPYTSRQTYGSNPRNASPATSMLSFLAPQQADMHMHC